MYLFGSCIGKETLLREFKSCSLYVKGTGVTNEVAEELLQSGDFVFQKAIEDNLNEYIEYYFLKYATSFFNIQNRSSLHKTAELLYGVNDKGIVTGIPSMKKIDPCAIMKSINTMIEKKEKMYHPRLKEIISYYRIEVHPVKFSIRSNQHSDYNDTMYNEWKTIEINNKERYNQYVTKNKKVTKLITFYTQKINLLLKNSLIQQELILYIESRLEYKDYRLLQHMKYKIKHGIGMMKNVDFESIIKHKLNKDSIYYWITQFKDDRIKFLKCLKPSKPSFQSTLYPNSLIAQVEPMIPLWMMKNPKLQLYVIRFQFDIQKFRSTQKIYYKSNYHDEFITCTRTKDLWGNPCCL